jgi:hypothetical protein
MTTDSSVGSYSYPAAGQPQPHAVTAAGSNSYTYDDAGNMLAGAGRTMTWDGQNRVATVATATTAYAFAPDGDRIKTVVTPNLRPGGHHVHPTSRCRTPTCAPRGLIAICGSFRPT